MPRTTKPARLSPSGECTTIRLSQYSKAIAAERQAGHDSAKPTEPVQMWIGPAIITDAFGSFHEDDPRFFNRGQRLGNMRQGAASGAEKSARLRTASIQEVRRAVDSIKTKLRARAEQAGTLLPTDEDAVGTYLSKTESEWDDWKAAEKDEAVRLVVRSVRKARRPKKK